MTILQDTINLTDISIWESIDRHLFCSDISSCSMGNLRKTLFLYLPQAQQPDIKGYLTELHQSGQNATLSPGMFRSQILAKAIKGAEIDSIFTTLLGPNARLTVADLMPL